MSTEEGVVDAPVPTESPLAAALAKVQMEIPIIPKKNTANIEGKDGKRGYQYTYADLADLTRAIMPLLGKNGLSFSALPTLVGDAFVLHYVLAHSSGETREGIYPLPDPRHARAQDEGSAITYARRYCLGAATGVVSEDDDDDAAAATKAGPAADATPTPPQKPPMAKGEWGARIADINDTVALRDLYHEVEEAGELGLRFNAAQWKFVQGTATYHGLPNPPRDVTVVQLINTVGNALKAAAPAQNPGAPRPGVEGGDGWPVVDIPKDEGA